MNEFTRDQNSVNRGRIKNETFKKVREGPNQQILSEMTIKSKQWICRLDNDEQIGSNVIPLDLSN